jgi:hypothetical protein
MPKPIDSKSDTSEPPAGIGVWIGAGLVLGMFGMVALMGLLTFYAGLRLLVTGEQHWGVALLVTAMGVVFAGIGFGFFWFQYVKAPVLRARRKALEARYPNQPWMLRADWAARRVTDSNLGVMIFMWVWVTGWWGAILFIWSMNRDKILAAAAASWWEAALGLIFPLAGLAGLLVAVHVTRAWWRYGRSTLRIDTLPGYLGEQFRGTLEASFRTRPARLEADLICEAVTWVTRRRNGKTERERVSETLWSATYALEPSRMMLAGSAGGQARLPIAVPLPANQPPCGLDEGGDGIVWRLAVREVRDEVARPADAGGGAGGPDGPPFSASFEVPVFGRQGF